MLSLVLIKNRNAPIPTMKIRQIEYLTGFLNSTLWNIRCSLNPKALVVNKAQQQHRPEPYFAEFFKSLVLMSLMSQIILILQFDQIAKVLNI